MSCIRIQTSASPEQADWHCWGNCTTGSCCCGWPGLNVLIPDAPASASMVLKWPVNNANDRINITALGTRNSWLLSRSICPAVCSHNVAIAEVHVWKSYVCAPCKLTASEGYTPFHFIIPARKLRWQNDMTRSGPQQHRQSIINAVTHTESFIVV
jgi:hypothetical protein